MQFCHDSKNQDCRKLINLVFILLLLVTLFSFEVVVADETSFSLASSKNSVIGFLVTHNKTILIKSSVQGPVYSIQSDTGKTLAVDLTIKELIARYPDLNQTLTKGLASDDASLYLPVSPLDSPKF